MNLRPSSQCASTAPALWANGHLFHRHRPVLENPLVTLTSYGFPSGHTMSVTVLFGLLALFLAKTVSTAGAAFAYFIAAGLVILLIGLTRVYLGAHFLSDVLGAFAASVVWLTFCWTAFETLRRRQKHRSERGRSPAEFTVSDSNASADPIRITLTTFAAEYSWVNPIQVWTPGTVDFAKGEVRFKAYAV